MWFHNYHKVQIKWKNYILMYFNPLELKIYKHILHNNNYKSNWEDYVKKLNLFQTVGKQNNMHMKHILN
jgi:hypothetical protein